MLDFGQFFDIMVFAVEHNDTQQYRSGHNEHDWKSCVRQKRTESSNLSCCARKSTTQQGGAFLFESEIRTGCERSEKTPRRGVCHPLCVSRCGNTASESLLLRQKKPSPNRVVLFFLNQRFEQGVSEAKKRPGGAFVTRCACRGVVTPRANLSCCARKSHHPTGWWLFFLIGDLLYSPSAAPAASTALRTHSVQGHRTLPVSMPFKSLQIVAPHLSRKPRRISRA